jgi:antirestriction protein ArdC
MKDAPKIVHKHQEAYYSPKDDYINMPKIKSFVSSESYYGTLFHELIHSTGHESRLNRKEVAQNPAFGSEMYSLEELVAEIGGCYLKSYTGIPIEELQNSAAYIKGWLDVFKGDRRFIMKASSRSQLAVEYVLNSKALEDDLTKKEQGNSIE